MGTDSPDGSSRPSTSGYADILSQDVISLVNYSSASIGAGANTFLWVENTNPNKLYQVVGYRLVDLGGSTFHASMYHNTRSLGSVRVVGQLIETFPPGFSILLDYGDYIGGYLYNDDVATRTLRFYGYYKTYPKPVGWVRKPEAYFIADDYTPALLADVTFTDQSLFTPTSWLWDFGDGNTSTDQNPVHAYAVAGSYLVVLTARNAGGLDTFTRVLTAS